MTSKDPVSSFPFPKTYALVENPPESEWERRGSSRIKEAFLRDLGTLSVHPSQKQLCGQLKEN